jgi:prepilin-type N-terminal cleavage/methylation domain-containing protein
MRRHLGRPARGFSLIEALIALAVMAIGMLGIVGVQSTLRLSSDVAKQRSEAVRLAQQAIEDTRSFTLVESMVGFTTYSDIATLAGQQIIGPATNTSYFLNYTVIDAVDPRLKTLRVNVNWTDRTGAAQTVEMNTAVTRIMPELAATLAMPSNIDINGMPTRGPLGRNASIPSPAVNIGHGTSGYVPPGRVGGDQTAWVFNNLTGVIQLCTSVVASNAALAVAVAAAIAAGQDPASLFVCAGGSAWLLSGYVGFGTAGTVAQALSPSGAVQALAVSVNQTFPAAAMGSCYTDIPQGSAVPYLCAVPVTTVSVPPSAWSGSSQVNGLAGAPTVCRYTGIALPIPNSLHPLNYSLVSGPLVQQNFLVLPNGSLCPGPLAANLTTVTP